MFQILLNIQLMLIACQHKKHFKETLNVLMVASDGLQWYFSLDGMTRSAIKIKKNKTMVLVKNITAELHSFENLLLMKQKFK